MIFSKNKNKPASGKSGIQESLKNPEILEVNLIQGEVKVSFDWKKRLPLIFLALFLTAVFVGDVYYVLGLWEKNEASSSQYIEDETAKVKGQVSAMQAQDADALSYKDKAAAVSQMISAHVYWTNFFSWLEKNTLSTVTYKSFTGQTDGAYSLDAVASSYAEASWQAELFRTSPFVKEVDIKSVDRDKGVKDAFKNVGFSIDLQVDPSIFKR